MEDPMPPSLTVTGRVVARAFLFFGPGRKGLNGT